MPRVCGITDRRMKNSQEPALKTQRSKLQTNQRPLRRRDKSRGCTLKKKEDLRVVSVGPRFTLYPSASPCASRVSRCLFEETTFHMSCPQNTLRAASLIKPATPKNTCHIARARTHTLEIVLINTCWTRMLREISNLPPDWGIAGPGATRAGRQESSPTIKSLIFLTPLNRPAVFSSLSGTFPLLPSSPHVSPPLLPSLPG